MDKTCKNCPHCVIVGDCTYVCISGDSKFLFNKVDPDGVKECFEGKEEK